MKPKNIRESWFQELRSSFEDSRLEDLRQKLSKNASNICPEIEKVFKAFSYFDFGNTKVVLVFLSPYQRQLMTESGLTNYATGLATAVPSGEFLTPTLGILLSALEHYLQIPEIEEHFDWTLESWAQQGILLLNRALTVEKNGNARSHIDDWTWFTRDVIKNLSDKLDRTMFVFLGKDAQYLDCVDRNKHEVLYTCHPVATAYAYDNAGKSTTPIPDHLDFPKFEMFKKVDEFMLKTHNSKIQWIK